MTVDDLLIEARGVLPHRPGPAEALAAQAAGALPSTFVATISAGPAGWSPGPLVLSRNSPERRCDPRVTVATPGDQRLGPAAHPDLRRGLSAQFGGGHLAQARPGERH